MKLILLAASLLLLTFFMPAPQRAESPADIVFKNGNVYTANDKAARAQAIAVKATASSLSVRTQPRRGMLAQAHASSI